MLVLFGYLFCFISVIVVVVLACVFCDWEFHVFVVLWVLFGCLFTPFLLIIGVVVFCVLLCLVIMFVCRFC